MGYGMKKRIMFMPYTDSNWMGGVYYVKNIIYQFLSYERSLQEFDVYIYINKGNEDIFEFCRAYGNVKFIYKKMSNGNKIKNKLVDIELKLTIWLNRIDYVYPDYDGKYIANPKMISWIPDFQHVYLKDFFSEEEQKRRNIIFGKIARKHRKLILSSQDSYATYCRLYPKMTQDVYIVPFVSAIEVKDLIDEPVSVILKKYNVGTEDFFLVSNQFWQHKNHVCLIEAIKIAKQKYKKNIVAVCTGYTSDLRKNEYFESLIYMIKQNNLQDNIKILGLIPRDEQLKLMETAIAVVQPSLFEGWGTVVEDAKTLGKIIVMSDIEVHKEQRDSKSILFAKDSAEDLANILIGLWDQYNGKAKVYSYGIHKKREYGKAFFDAITSK